MVHCWVFRHSFSKHTQAKHALWPLFLTLCKQIPEPCLAAKFETSSPLLPQFDAGKPVKSHYAHHHRSPPPRRQEAPMQHMPSHCFPDILFSPTGQFQTSSYGFKEVQSIESCSFVFVVAIFWTLWSSRSPYSRPAVTWDCLNKSIPYPVISFSRPLCMCSNGKVTPCLSAPHGVSDDRFESAVVMESMERAWLWKRSLKYTPILIASMKMKTISAEDKNVTEGRTIQRFGFRIFLQY